jgi:hypothetical protein
MSSRQPGAALEYLGELKGKYAGAVSRPALFKEFRKLVYYFFNICETRSVCVCECARYSTFLHAAEKGSVHSYAWNPSVGLCCLWRRNAVMQPWLRCPFYFLPLLLSLSAPFIFSFCTFYFHFLHLLLSLSAPLTFTSCPFYFHFLPLLLSLSAPFTFTFCPFYFHFLHLLLSLSAPFTFSFCTFYFHAAPWLSRCPLTFTPPLLLSLSAPVSGVDRKTCVPEYSNRNRASLDYV